MQTTIVLSAHALPVCPATHPTGPHYHCTTPKHSGPANTSKFRSLPKCVVKASLNRLHPSAASDPSNACDAISWTCFFINPLTCIGILCLKLVVLPRCSSLEPPLGLPSCMNVMLSGLFCGCTGTHAWVVTTKSCSICTLLSQWP